jgi:hypothetical protein
VEEWKDGRVEGWKDGRMDDRLPAQLSNAPSLQPQGRSIHTRRPFAPSASDRFFCSTLRTLYPPSLCFSSRTNHSDRNFGSRARPERIVPTILSGWYTGLFSILAFAFQVLLILVAGYALSTYRPVRLLSNWLASFGSTPRRAILITIVAVFIASFLNWEWAGCGGPAYAGDRSAHSNRLWMAGRSRLFPDG